MAEVDVPTQMGAPIHPAPYPEAPWHAHGAAWVGLFAAREPAVLPAGLTSLAPPHWRILGLVRYTSGSTLVYDEAFVGVLARVGLAPGLYIEKMWVDSELSLWGGRAIWGMPKELADFRWQGEHCELRDASNHEIATFGVNRSTRARLVLPGYVTAIGRRPTAWALLTAPLWARASLGGLTLERSDAGRLGATVEPRPRIALHAPEFHVRFQRPLLRPARSQAFPPFPGMA